MNKLIRVTLTILFLTTISSVYAEKPAISGAETGKWTQDMDAAAALAKEKNLPMLINFTGSDWCGWCKLMDSNVFSKQAWQDYAKDRLVLVTIDFPKDKSIVPEKFVSRNEELKNKFGVQGFPTYMVLESDAMTVLGQLGAGRDTTPESFISGLNSLLRFRDATVAEYTSGMKPEDKTEYLNLVKQLRDCENGIKAAREQITRAEEQIETLEAQSGKIMNQTAEFRAKQLGPDQLKEFKQLQGELEKAKEQFSAWIKSEPERTGKNMELAKTMADKIKNLEEKLSNF